MIYHLENCDLLNILCDSFKSTALDKSDRNARKVCEIRMFKNQAFLPNK